MWLPFGKSSRRRLVRRLTAQIMARFDAAQTTDENRRHWANADDLSPIAAAGPDVRRIVRSRARHEVANNSIARGIALTLANDLVGTGPRLDLLTPDRALNAAIEKEFGHWAREIGLPAKLRTMRMARFSDGEAFGVMFTNRASGGPVKLDVKLIEGDRVGTPHYGWNTDEKKRVDGITFDAEGNPENYHILKRHPGAADSRMGIDEFDTVPASSVIHWFRADRPGQRRGIPDIMPALGLFAILRRFTKATLLAAETAAEFALVMKTTSPAGGEAAEVDPWVTMEMQRNIAMFAPEGWEPTQMKAQHPGATFEEFRKAIINEAARCVNMPLNIATCDSSDYNYASGRLDHQTYYRSIDVERDDLEHVALDPLLRAWLSEAILVSNYLPLSARMLQSRYLYRLNHQWFWRGREHVDPLKESRAAIALRDGLLQTDAEYYGLKGQDWEDQYDQLEREQKGRRERGLEGEEPGETGAAGREAAAGLGALAELTERVEDLEDAAS